MNSGASVATMNMPTLGELKELYAPVLDEVRSLTNKNTEASAKMAAEQNAWQRETNKIAMDFNMQEAAKNRDWQEYMSNTAHQREVRDLMASGLNPILSAGGGNGASVGSGATASGVTSSGAKGEVDTASSTALVTLMSTFLNSMMDMQAMNMSAINNMAMAERANATNVRMANISAGAAIQAATLNSEANKYGSARSLAGMVYSSDKALEGSKYASDKSYQSAQDKIKSEEYLRKYYPSSNAGLIPTTARYAADFVEDAVDFVKGLFGKGKGKKK